MTRPDYWEADVVRKGFATIVDQDSASVGQVFGVGADGDIAFAEAATDTPDSSALPVDAAQGFLAQAFDRALCSAVTGADGSGTLCGTLVSLKAGMVVTGAVCAVQAAAVTGTHGYLALYSKAGVRLAMSADTPALFQSGGLRSAAFTAPYTVVADDGFFVCYLTTWSGSGPSFMGGGSQSVGDAFGSSATRNFFLGSQTSPPSTANVTSNRGVTPWMAAY